MPASTAINNTAAKLFASDRICNVRWYNSNHFFISESLPSNYLIADTIQTDQAKQIENLKENLFNSIKKDNTFVLKGVSGHALKTLTNDILNEIYLFEPSLISVQVSSIESLLFSFIKDDFKVYLEYFFNQNNSHIDECLVTAFKGDEIVLDYSGTLVNSYIACDKMFANYNNILPKQLSDINVLDLSIDSFADQELQVYSL